MNVDDNDLKTVDPAYTARYQALRRRMHPAVAAIEVHKEMVGEYHRPDVIEEARRWSRVLRRT